MTYREIYEAGIGALAAARIEEADLDARLLLEFVCDTDRNTLLVHGERTVSEEEEKRYRELLGKRGKRIPLQHLTGVQNFMGLDFSVNAHVLIPRQDTEILVEEALKKAGRTDLIGYGRHCLIRPEKGDAAYRLPAQKAASGPGKPARPAKKKTIRNIHKKKTP